MDGRSAVDAPARVRAIQPSGRHLPVRLKALKHDVQVQPIEAAHPTHQVEATQLISTESVEEPLFLRSSTTIE